MEQNNYQQNRYNGGRPRIGGQQRNSFGYGNQRQSFDGDHGNNQPSAQTVFAEAGFKASWITNEADSSLVVFAEKMGKEMATGRDKEKLTNSKIRSIYGEIKRIQVGGFENNKASFYLLRPKVAYALGRDPQNRGLQLFKLVFDKAAESVTDQKSYRNFCNLIEAILAYHKANGGKDN